jgi:hypothetical protein
MNMMPEPTIMPTWAKSRLTSIGSLSFCAGQDGEQRGRTAHQGVAVGWRVRHRLPGDQTTGARASLDQHLLAPAGRELVGDSASRYIQGTAGWDRQDDLDRLGWKVLCHGGRGDERRCNKNGGKQISIHLALHTAGASASFRWTRESHSMFSDGTGFCRPSSMTDTPG